MPYVLFFLALALADFNSSLPPPVAFVPRHVIEARRRQPCGKAGRVRGDHTGAVERDVLDRVLGRPETNQIRGVAMNVLGNGLFAADHHDEGLSVREAELSTKLRLGASEDHILVAQNNLAGAYGSLGRLDDCVRTQRDVYSGRVKLHGEGHPQTLTEALNYANSLGVLQRFEDAKALLRKTIPVAQRVLGESHDLTLRMRRKYAETLCKDPSATLDDLREAVTTLVETDRIARRVLGTAHPLTKGIEGDLQYARAALDARETPPSSGN